jgi:hypothetical protein
LIVRYQTRFCAFEQRLVRQIIDRVSNIVTRLRPVKEFIGLERGFRVKVNMMNVIRKEDNVRIIIPA